MDRIDPRHAAHGECEDAGLHCDAAHLKALQELCGATISRDDYLAALIDLAKEDEQFANRAAERALSRENPMLRPLFDHLTNE